MGKEDSAKGRRRVMDLRYDPHQFANRPNRPASATTGIDFNDYSRMATIRRSAHVKRGAGVPAWVHDAEKLRRVVAACVWSFIFQKQCPLPESFARDWRALKEAADREFARYVNNQGTYEAREIAKGVAKAGGLAELFTAILWRSWRLGEDSVTVAEALHISPTNVRQRLLRIKGTAKWLGFEE